MVEPGITAKAVSFVGEKLASTLAEKTLGKGSGWVRDSQPGIWFGAIGVRSRVHRIRGIGRPDPGPCEHFSPDGSAENILRLCKILHRAMDPSFDLGSFFQVNGAAIRESVDDFLASGEPPPRRTLDLVTALASIARFLDAEARADYVAVIEKLVPHVSSPAFSRAFIREHEHYADNGGAKFAYEANLARASHRIDALHLRGLAAESPTDVMRHALSCEDLNVYLHQTMIKVVALIKSGDFAGAIARADCGIARFKNHHRSAKYLQHYKVLEGANSTVEIALANVVRVRARAKLLLHLEEGSSATLRSARQDLRIAHYLFSRPSSPWRHGIANTLLLASALAIMADRHQAGVGLLEETYTHYDWTGDHEIAEQVFQRQERLLQEGCSPQLSHEVLMLAV